MKALERWQPTRGQREAMLREIKQQVRVCNEQYESVIVGSECFDARGNGGGVISPTTTGDHNSRVNDYCAVVCQKTVVFDETQIISPQNGSNPKPNGPCHTLTKTAKPPVLCIQGKSIGRADKNAPNGSGINEGVSFTLNTVDQHAVVYALDRASFNQGANALYDFDINDGGINSTLVAKEPSAVAYRFIEWIVRRLTPLECERIQGYPDYWTKLPKIEDMTEEDYSFFLKAFLLDREIKAQSQLSDIYAEIEESDKETAEKLLIKANEITERLEKIKKKPPTKPSLVKWYNKLDCDGNRYKMCGNSLAIPCALRVVSGIADYITKTGGKTE